eukprot:scaffold214036_cov30-Tisochrysis_lutea.AAC.2
MSCSSCWKARRSCGKNDWRGGAGSDRWRSDHACAMCGGRLVEACHGRCVVQVLRPAHGRKRVLLAGPAGYCYVMPIEGWRRRGPMHVIRWFTSPRLRAVAASCRWSKSVLRPAHD